MQETAIVIIGNGHNFFNSSTNVWATIQHVNLNEGNALLTIHCSICWIFSNFTLYAPIATFTRMPFLALQWQMRLKIPIKINYAKLHWDTHCVCVGWSFAICLPKLAWHRSVPCRVSCCILNKTTQYTTFAWRSWPATRICL